MSGMFGWQIEDLCRLVDTELGYASGATLGRNKTKVGGHSVYVRVAFGKLVQGQKLNVEDVWGRGGGGG